MDYAVATRYVSIKIDEMCLYNEHWYNANDWDLFWKPLPE